MASTGSRSDGGSGGRGFSGGGGVTLRAEAQSDQREGIDFAVATEVLVGLEFLHGLGRGVAPFAVGLVGRQVALGSQGLLDFFVTLRSGGQLAIAPSGGSADRAFFATLGGGRPGGARRGSRTHGFLVSSRHTLFGCRFFLCRGHGAG